MNIAQKIADELSLKLTQVESAIGLIDEGATIPFIARYRKEVTGSLDDTQLRALDDRLAYLRGLEQRKLDVLSSIESQEKLTPELEQAIKNASTLVEVEDLYRPYKQKRRTRASVARERGLEPLAEMLNEQRNDMGDPLVLAEDFVDAEKEVETAEDALAGAMDIIAEQISDSADIRKDLRDLMMRRGEIVTTAATEEDSVYAIYYEFNESCRTIPGHRILAINRGEREDMLKVSVQVDSDMAVGVIHNYLLKKGCENSPARKYLIDAAADSYTRLLFPSMENEIRNLLTEKAAEAAIVVFAENLNQLLMQPPVKDRVVLGLDPAYRTGCKIAVVDGTGKVLDTTVIYPTPPVNKIAEAKVKLKQLIKTHNVSLISIGNGTASKESEIFVAELIAEIPEHEVAYMVVSEAGASVYSASKLAAEEFPEFDVSLRSAVSIARRIQDPLAELVKIDPKAIGVGQYQHDMPKARLDQSLGGVVESCVNSVGVDINTASRSLLSYVAGINSTVANNIVQYREENGRFVDRKQLLKVPRLGPKAYEQCAGFLRIKDGKNILDNTAVHPESYKATKKLLEECGFKLADVAGGKISDLKQRASGKGLEKISESAGVGVPTLSDIMDELLKPGRDPRDSLPAPLLRTDVMSLEDLEPGMELQGTVRNIVDFGAFVDIAVHEDGLVHISQLSDKYVKHPLDVVKVGDIVKVRVLSVDIQKKRISLTMKNVK